MANKLHFLAPWSDRGTSWNQNHVPNRSWKEIVQLYLSRSYCYPLGLLLLRFYLWVAKASHHGSRCRRKCLGLQVCYLLITSLTAYCLMIRFIHSIMPPCFESIILPSLRSTSLCTSCLWIHSCLQKLLLSESLAWVGFYSFEYMTRLAYTILHNYPLLSLDWIAAGFLNSQPVSGSRSRWELARAIYCLSVEDQNHLVAWALWLDTFLDLVRWSWCFVHHCRIIW